MYVILGGGFIFFIFTPTWGNDSQFDEHIFQMGWFNHQLEIRCFCFPCIYIYYQGGIYHHFWVKKSFEKTPSQESRPWCWRLRADAREPWGSYWVARLPGGVSAKRGSRWSWVFGVRLMEVLKGDLMIWDCGIFLIYVIFMRILCMYFFLIYIIFVYIYICCMIKEKFLWISLTFSFWKVSCSCKDRSLNWRWLYELCFAHVHNGFGWFVRSLHYAEHKLRNMWMKSSWCNQCCNHMELLGCFGFVWFWCFFRLTVIM